MRADLARELWFLLRDRAACVWLTIAFVLSALAVGFGLAEVRDQRETIRALVAHDAADRAHALEGHDDWGGAAYYAFHFTYAPPSDLAFAAMGQRDSSPWKHRVRMLALEGQIHESDTRNADFGLVGRFDFAFMAACVAPLLLIMLIHDLRASERVARRHDLLVATAGSALQPWLPRAIVRLCSLALALLAPLWVGALLEGTALAVVVQASLVVVGSLLVWWLIVEPVSRVSAAPSILLTALIGIWLSVAIVLPAVSRAVIEASVPAPDGGEILLLQRETVNAAWDLPKEDTMTAFVAEHPQWQSEAKITSPFEWKWYYAFQQVGDQRARPLVQQYRDARIERDRLAGWVSLVLPPSFVERAFEALARTDAATALAYEDRVRAFHAELRAFHYPLLFRDVPFDRAMLRDLPQFAAAPRQRAAEPRVDAGDG